MSKFQVLDCTLRDGGYINDWKFGRYDITSILSKLSSAKIDIVECGFLEDIEYNKECSFFSQVDQIENLLPSDKGDTQYVAMTRFGFLNLDNLKPYDGKSIDGIRVTFHEDEARDAIPYCKQIKEKGYKVYVQPVGTTSYTDKYLLELIEMVNDIKPYAFYIVDTLGLMRQNDLMRMFYLLDNNLENDIVVGFHSHNNLQLSFSNAQTLADVQTKRSIIVDSSVYGMGRGAGNLNTELITQHLNMVKGGKYYTDYLLEIVDESISPLLEKYTWGYSVPYYLAAINNCHPNYATYLMNRKTLPIKSISTILNSIPLDKRELYDKEYISQLYTEYQQHLIDDADDIQQLSEQLNGRNILIIAPGSSIRKNYDRIKSHISDQKSVVISVNYDGNGITPDWCFFSNDKRFQRFIEIKGTRQSLVNTIVTSNIKSEELSYKYKVNYSSYLNSQPLVNDNATLMLLSLLIKLDVKEVSIAGFDGFQVNASENYFEDELETGLENDIMLNMNEQISEVVRDYSDEININFVTKSLYKHLVETR